MSARHRLSIFNATIADPALHADCDTLWSGERLDGMTLENTLRIVNPFLVVG